MALPGLIAAAGDLATAKAVIDTMLLKIKDGLFPNSSKQQHDYYNSIDAPLWFIWSLQQLEKSVGLESWRLYKQPILQIMNAYRTGTAFGIRMSDNGLIHGEEGIPLTWMDAMVDGQQVTPRPGFAVEVNALWYNAVCQLLEWAGPRSKSIAHFKDLPELIRNSFQETFWLKEKNYLADYEHNGYRDHAVRPNQVIAGSLDHSPITTEMKKGMLDVVKSELLTTKGLRTLSPKNVLFRGVYSGDQERRDRAAHQGSVYPWLLDHFVRCYLTVYKRSGLSTVKEIHSGFEEDMVSYGIGTISELYDGNPPHDPRGAISYAPSVAALLRIGDMIEQFDQTD